MSRTVQQQLAELVSLTGSAPPFDPDLVPETPGSLFEQWFTAAIETGVLEPHAMTLSTVASSGMPDARVLILKGFDPAGRWAFASSARSAKGAQLAQRPAAALSFFWPSMTRAVRIRGAVSTGSAATSRDDFRARSSSARAIALSGRQSAPLDSVAELDADIERARERLDDDPELGDAEWRTYWLTAESVEFWQGDPSRRHVRVEYRRMEGRWVRGLLRP